MMAEPSGLSDDRLGEVAIVHGGVQIVVHCGLVAVDPDGGIDVEVLAVLALEVEDAVVREYPQALKFDLVVVGVVLHATSLFRNRPVHSALG